jgi:hypothetical protein
MSDDLADLINTRLQPVGKRYPTTSRFNGLPADHKHSTPCGSTGLKPGANESASWKLFDLS